MTTSFETAFALHYAGRHRPDDALWWLTHPTTPGPSGALPPQTVFLDTISSLEDPADYHLAAALLNAALELLRTDLRAAIDALERATAALPAVPCSAESARQTP